MTNVKPTEAVKGERSSNRLIDETSTYLLQHAYNPVDWYPWGEEALARAKNEDKPILLSIGYAACHWCHVMEHESFEDEDTAKMMNERFINIKVDREERTDLDEIYMKAVQLMTGHGGWPMTVFLTPDLEPFFAGTYFPPEDRHGMPSFRKILGGVNQAWQNNRPELLESAAEVTKHLKQMDDLSSVKSGVESELSLDLISKTVVRLAQNFDSKWGGFGSAPKFPHSFSLLLCMRVAFDEKASDDLRKKALEVVETTLDRMAFGGMNDQIGGGFARYSVDRQWLVPHFEKMLYDNALLCLAYLDGYRLTGRTYWKRVAGDILDFVSRELRTENGAFFSSLDADSEGEEGKFYVWTPAQIKESLGDADGDWFCENFGISSGGNFEHGTSIANLTDSPESLASRSGLTVDEFWQKADRLKNQLLTHREERVRPGRDEKVLTSWNSLMISAYVEGYKVLRDPKYLEEARSAAAFIFDNLMVDGRLLRTWGKGKAKLNGYLDDYSYFVQAMLDLASVDTDQRYLDTAVELTEEMISQFKDESEASFFYTSDQHDKLIVRPKTHFDGSVPSANSVAVMNLLRLAELLSNETYKKIAEGMFHQYLPLFEKAPSQFANLLLALDFHLRGTREIAVIQSQSDGEVARELLLTVHDGFRPYQVVLAKVEGRDHKTESPLLESRGCVEGKSTVYVCENYSCRSPVTDKDELETLLA